MKQWRIAFIVIVLLFLSRSSIALSTELKIDGVSFAFQKIKIPVKYTSLKGGVKSLSASETEALLYWMQIDGDGFNALPYLNQVFVGHLHIPVLHSTRNTILCLVDPEITLGGKILIVREKEREVRYTVNFTNQCDLMNLPVEERNRSFFQYNTVTTQTGFSNDRQYKISIIQDLDKIQSGVDVNKNKRDLKLIEWTIVRQKPGFVSYVQSATWQEKKSILSNPALQSISPGEEVLVAAIVSGNQKYNLNIRFDLKLNVNNRPVVYNDPLQSDVKISVDPLSSGNYAVLQMFLFRMPYDIQSKTIEMELSVKSTRNPNRTIRENKTLSVKTSTPNSLKINRTFFHVRNEISFLPDAELDDYSVKQNSSILPGQLTNLYQLFSAMGSRNDPDKVTCSFEFMKEGKSVKTFSYSANIPHCNIDSGVVLEFFTPDYLVPGTYSVKNWIEGEKYYERAYGNPLSLTVENYNPTMEGYTWPIRPIQIPDIMEGDFNTIRNIMLTNAINEVSKNDRLCLLTDWVVKGFPPIKKGEKKNINYFYLFEDQYQQTMKISGSTYSEKSNTLLRMYHAMDAPSKLASGPIRYTVELEIDGEKYNVQNGFILK